MHKIIAIAFVSTALAAFPAAMPAYAVDTSISAFCGPDAPEGYKRPGGYCEEIGSNNDSNTRADDCNYYYQTNLEIDLLLKDQAPILVAVNCYYGSF